MHSWSQLAAVAMPFHSSGHKSFVGRRSLEQLYEFFKPPLTSRVIFLAGTKPSCCQAPLEKRKKKFSSHFDQRERKRIWDLGLVKLRELVPIGTDLQKISS